MRQGICAAQSLGCTNKIDKDERTCPASSVCLLASRYCLSSMKFLVIPCSSGAVRRLSSSVTHSCRILSGGSMIAAIVYLSEHHVVTYKGLTYIEASAESNDGRTQPIKGQIPSKSKKRAESLTLSLRLPFERLPVTCFMDST